jgi:hypothetical protein
MIESQVVEAIINSSTTAGSRVVVGARLQSQILPAVVVTISAGARVALGNKTLAMYEVSIASIADSMIAAQGLSDSIADGMPINLSSYAVVNTGFGVLDDPVVADGDEQNPAICTSNYMIYGGLV